MRIPELFATAVYGPDGLVGDVLLSDASFADDLPREPDDAAALARHYAELYSALEDAGLPVPPGEADTANGELRGTGWRVGRVPGGWRAVQDAGDASFAAERGGEFAPGGGRVPGKGEAEGVPLATAEQISQRTRQVPSRWIQPPDPVMDRNKVASMAAEMEEAGAWVGRPVLVVETDDDEYQAWTGSHRLAAAVRAGVEADVVRVDEDELAQALEKAGHEADTHPNGLDDEEKADVFAHLNDPVARELMRQEIERYGQPSLGDASFAAERAPAGGVTIGGKDYRGGQFIPAAVVAKATPAERAALERGKEPAEAKAAARRARGPLNVTALRGRLTPHAAPLSREEARSAASSWRMLLRHHGGLALHRVEELATLSENALANVGDDHPNAEGLRNYFGRQLAKYHGMIGMAEAAGVTGKVEATPTHTSSPGGKSVVEQVARAKRAEAVRKQVLATAEQRDVKRQAALDQIQLAADEVGRLSEHTLGRELSLSEKERRAQLWANIQAADEDYRSHTGHTTEEAHAALFAAVRSPVRWDVDTRALAAGTRIHRKAHAEAMKFLNRAVSGVDVPPEARRTAVFPISLNGEQRDHYAYNGAVHLSMKTDAGTVVHEYGHAIDDLFPGVLKASVEFLRHRVGSEAGVSMSQHFPGANFRPDELGRKDDFEKVWGSGSSEAYYAGKDYGERATEILSMGLERLYRDPVGFARSDPEYHNFVVGVLLGEVRGDR